MATIQKFVVNGPRPLPPKYRLVDVANVIESPDPHWQTGLSVWGYPPTGDWVPDTTSPGYVGGAPDQPATWALCWSDASTAGVKSTGTSIPNPLFDAFTVYLAAQCTTASVFTAKLDGETQDEYQSRMQQAFVDRALQSFGAAESWAVEREFSQGLILPGNPFLGDANAVVLAGGVAQKPRVALSYLANAIGQTGQAGIVHADPATIVAWGEFFIRPEGEKLLTMEGSDIVRGSGYVGADVVGQSALAAGTSWAFATGLVDIRRSAPFIVPGDISEALDRGDNTINYYVERTYAVDWDTVLQAAVLVDWKI